MKTSILRSDARFPWEIRWPVLIWLLLVAGCIFGAVPAYGAVAFAQLTDPHIFDSPAKEAADNKIALRWCVSQLNIEEPALKYDFIAVTGDLGLEKLAAADTATQKAAASELAQIITSSAVKTWLFVPGNNDLIKEDPATLPQYRTFLKALQEGVRPITKSSICAQTIASRCREFIAREHWPLSLDLTMLLSKAMVSPRMPWPSKRNSSRRWMMS